MPARQDKCRRSPLIPIKESIVFSVPYCECDIRLKYVMKFEYDIGFLSLTVKP